jgi:CubicO group peptidase (beta-lactamase class C family)
MLGSSTLRAFVSGRKVKLEGTVHPDFAPLCDRLRRQIEVNQGGAALCVYRRGRKVVDLWGGVRDQSGRPWTADTMSPSFSTTKGVASTLVHMMADRGLLDYDERVAHYWPEFAQAGKSEITLRQVLSHQSGLYHIRQMIDHADRMRDWAHMVEAIERTPPVHPPGERTGYHGLTYGFIVGELLNRVTGVPFSQLVQEELVGPLDLDGMYIGTPASAMPRAAQLIWPEAGRLGKLLFSVSPPPWTGPVIRGFNTLSRESLKLMGLQLDVGSIVDALAPRGISSLDFGSPLVLAAAIPAANGLFTARSLARMYAALAGGGEIDGVQLMSRATLERASEIQGEAAGRSVLPIDMRWRLGFHGVATTTGFIPEAFGHFGYGGSGAWADPKRELAVGMIVNCGMGTPLGDMRIARISGTVLRCAREVTKREAAKTPAGDDIPFGVEVRA